jgi:hypothetical protein
MIAGTPGVNFTNVFHTRFSDECLFSSYELEKRRSYSYVQNVTGKNRAQKTLVKLNPGINIQNIFYKIVETTNLTNSPASMSSLTDFPSISLMSSSDFLPWIFIVFLPTFKKCLPSFDLYMSQARSFLPTDDSAVGVAVVAEGVAGSVADVGGSILGVS